MYMTISRHAPKHNDSNNNSNHTPHNNAAANPNNIPGTPGVGIQRAGYPVGSKGGGGWKRRGTVDTASPFAGGISSRNNALANPGQTDDGLHKRRVSLGGAAGFFSNFNLAGELNASESAIHAAAVEKEATVKTAQDHFEHYGKMNLAAMAWKEKNRNNNNCGGNHHVHETGKKSSFKQQQQQQQQQREQPLSIAETAKLSAKAKLLATMMDSSSASHNQNAPTSQKKSVDYDAMKTAALAKLASLKGGGGGGSSGTTTPITATAGAWDFILPSQSKNTEIPSILRRMPSLSSEQERADKHPPMPTRRKKTKAKRCNSENSGMMRKQRLIEKERKKKSKSNRRKHDDNNNGRAGRSDSKPERGGKPRGEQHHDDPPPSERPPRRLSCPNITDYKIRDVVRTHESSDEEECIGRKVVRRKSRQLKGRCFSLDSDHDNGDGVGASEIIAKPRRRASDRLADPNLTDLYAHLDDSKDQEAEKGNSTLSEESCFDGNQTNTGKVRSMSFNDVLDMAEEFYSCDDDGDDEEDGNLFASVMAVNHQLLDLDTFNNREEILGEYSGSNSMNHSVHRSGNRTKETMTNPPNERGDSANGQDCFASSELVIDSRLADLDNSDVQSEYDEDPLYRHNKSIPSNYREQRNGALHAGEEKVRNDVRLFASSESAVGRNIRKNGYHDEERNSIYPSDHRGVIKNENNAGKQAKSRSDDSRDGGEGSIVSSEFSVESTNGTDVGNMCDSTFGKRNNNSETEGSIVSSEFSVDSTTVNHLDSESKPSHEVFRNSTTCGTDIGYICNSNLPKRKTKSETNASITSSYVSVDPTLIPYGKKSNPLQDVFGNSTQSGTDIDSPFDSTVHARERNNEPIPSSDVKRERRKKKKSAKRYNSFCSSTMKFDPPEEEVAERRKLQRFSSCPLIRHDYVIRDIDADEDVERSVRKPRRPRLKRAASERWKHSAKELTDLLGNKKTLISALLDGTGSDSDSVADENELLSNGELCHKHNTNRGGSYRFDIATSSKVQSTAEVQVLNEPRTEGLNDGLTAQEPRPNDKVLENSKNNNRSSIAQKTDDKEKLAVDRSSDNASITLSLIKVVSKSTSCQTDCEQRKMMKDSSVLATVATICTGTQIDLEITKDQVEKETKSQGTNTHYCAMQLECVGTQTDSSPSKNTEDETIPKTQTALGTGTQVDANILEGYVTSELDDYIELKLKMAELQSQLQLINNQLQQTNLRNAELEKENKMLKGEKEKDSVPKKQAKLEKTQRSNRGLWRKRSSRLDDASQLVSVEGNEKQEDDTRRERRSFSWNSWSVRLGGLNASGRFKGLDDSAVTRDSDNAPLSF